MSEQPETESRKRLAHWLASPKRYKRVQWFERSQGVFIADCASGRYGFMTSGGEGWRYAVAFLLRQMRKAGL